MMSNNDPITEDCVSLDKSNLDAKLNKRIDGLSTTVVELMLRVESNEHYIKSKLNKDIDNLEKTNIELLMKIESDRKRINDLETINFELLSKLENYEDQSKDDKYINKQINELSKRIENNEQQLLVTQTTIIDIKDAIEIENNLSSKNQEKSDINIIKKCTGNDVVYARNYFSEQKTQLEIFDIKKFNSYIYDYKIKYLYKCELNNCDYDDHYPIHKICLESNLNDVKLAFDIYNTLNIRIIDIKYKFNYSILDFVCFFAKSEIIKYVLDYYIENKFNFNYTDCNLNKTSLHYICGSNNIVVSQSDDRSELIKYFFEKFVEHNYNFNLLDTYGNHPAIYISENNWSLDLLEYIFKIYQDKKYNFDYETTIDKFKIINNICSNCKPEIIKRVLELYSENDMNIINNNNKLIFLILENNNVTSDLINFVLSYYKNRNISLNIVDKNFCHLSIIISKQCSIENIKLLFDIYKDTYDDFYDHYLNTCYKLFCERANEIIKEKIFTLYFTKNVLSNCIDKSIDGKSSINFSKYCTRELFYEILNICVDNNLKF